LNHRVSSKLGRLCVIVELGGKNKEMKDFCELEERMGSCELKLAIFAPIKHKKIMFSSEL
jgi:hypothetical protein